MGVASFSMDWSKQKLIQKPGLTLNIWLLVLFETEELFGVKAVAKKLLEAQ